MNIEPKGRPLRTVDVTQQMEAKVPREGIDPGFGQHPSEGEVEWSL
jgi:hypothetical protein